MHKVFLFLMLFSKSIWACPICFSSKEGARIPFYISTAVMSLIPLAMIFGFIVWYRKRIKSLASESEVN